MSISKCGLFGSISASRATIKEMLFGHIVYEMSVTCWCRLLVTCLYVSNKLTIVIVVKLLYWDGGYVYRTSHTVNMTQLNCLVHCRLDWRLISALVAQQDLWYLWDVKQCWRCTLFTRTLARSSKRGWKWGCCTDSLTRISASIQNSMYQENAGREWKWNQ